MAAPCAQAQAQAQAQDSLCCNKTTGDLGSLSSQDCQRYPNSVVISTRAKDRSQGVAMCQTLHQANETMLQALESSKAMLAQQGMAVPPTLLEKEDILRFNSPTDGDGDPVSGPKTSGGDTVLQNRDQTDPPPIPDYEDLIANMPGLPPGIDLSTIPGMPEGFDMSNIPGMPEGFDMSGLLGGKSGLSSTPIPQPQCCNIRTKMFAGAMEPALCRAEGADFLPDLPEYLQETEVCRIQQDGAGGGSSAALWDDDDHEENLGNAGMEQWVDANRPADFGVPFNVTRDMFPDAQAEFRTVFRDNDAHTGSYSLRLKNFDLTDIMPPERRDMVTAVLGGRPPVAPAGVNTCHDNCLKGGASVEAVATLDVPEVKTHVCGVYKGYIGPGDQLAIQVFNTDLAIGTGTEGMTRSSADWRKFALQLQAPKSQLPKSGTFGASIQIQSAGGVMAGGFGSDPNTQVNIDSLHMCDPIGLRAYHPKVITGGVLAIIPDSEEETAGVQTFVNLDNDDTDEFFDFDARDKAVTEDDELVLLRMYAPQGTRGKAVFKAPEGLGSVYRLWEDADKSRPFEDANQDPQDVQGFLRPGTRDDVIERRVWVEAIKPSQKSGDMIFEFIFLNQGDTERERTDTVVMTALQVDNIEFEGKGNGIDPTQADELDADPNWPSGFSGAKAWRVFPGKSWRDPDGDPNNKVDVKVTLNVEPTRAVPVYFKSFDVDDPTAEDDEVDAEDKAEDNRAKGPAAKTGRFPDGEEVYKFLMSQKEDRFEFEVTLQPGDNFRLAASGDKDALDALDNDDTKLAASDPRHTARIVDTHVFEQTDDATKAQHRRGQKRVSDVLTVWRKLHIEIDTMSAVKDNEYEAHIVSFENLGAGTVANSLTTKVWLTPSIYALLPDNAKSGTQGIKGAFLGGTANIEPWLTTNPYDILDNSANTQERDWLILSYPAGWGEMDISFKRKKIIFRDDDVTKDDDAVPALDTSQVISAFAPAYVLPTWDEIPNSTDTVAFRLNSPSDKPDNLRSYYQFENSQYEADPQLWTIYVLNAFQGMMSEDGDGEGEGAIAGESDNTALRNNGQGLHIYQESGRELIANRNKPDGTSPPGWTMADVLPHEIGHLFTGDHADEGLMWDPQDPRNSGQPDKRTDEFGAKTLDRIRTREHP